MLLLKKQTNMKTKVTLNKFKQSGKWYHEVKYTSDFTPLQSEELINEAKCYLPLNLDFTIYAECEDGTLLYQLIKMI
jgi:hypothetical protein